MHLSIYTNRSFVGSNDHVVERYDGFYAENIQTASMRMEKNKHIYIYMDRDQHHHVPVLLLGLCSSIG